MGMDLRRFGLGAFVGVAVISMLSLGFRTIGDDELTADQLVQRNLESIAASKALKSLDSFALRGDCAYKIVSGGSLSAAGMTQIVSKGGAYNILFQFQAGDLGATQYVTNGKKAETRLSAGAQMGPLRNFMEGYDVLLTEGLLGGELSTAWSLFDLKRHKPKLSYEGLQDVNGQKLHRLDYRIRKGGKGIQVRLYFEPETFHHVMSTYEVRQSAPASSDPDQSSQQRVSRQRLEERFADFKNLEGYVLPTTWTLLFTSSGNDAGVVQSSPALAGAGPSVGSVNAAPGGLGAAGSASRGIPGSSGGTIILEWTTKVTNSGANMPFPPNLITIK
ncbi:MAG: hypothetical protein WAO20_13315 [Acidobacteriota bacterium]